MSKAHASPSGFSMKNFSLKQLLGGMSPTRFLAEHWQKKPLLVRQALPGFGGWLNRDGLSQLACSEEAEGRLVQFKRNQWHLEHGPFTEKFLHALPAKNWSLLVSGVNHVMPQGDALLNAFNFIPRARLDDLMVSFAPNGGGVGPHFDSYDVFLIQGQGKRRWEISDQSDLTLVEGAPLRILENFSPSQAWELEPGDMLYLPPRFAHNGIALGDCMTWSVGFRAPAAQEMLGQFFNYLQDHMEASGLYADPDLKLAKNNAEIPAEMIEWTETVLQQARWNREHVGDFLGRYLSEPKAHIYFDPPARPLSIQRFSQTCEKKGLRLDPRSQLLYLQKRFFINGEAINANSSSIRALRTLANQRALPSGAFDDALVSMLYDWYCAGYVLFSSGVSTRT